MDNIAVSDEFGETIDFTDITPYRIVVSIHSFAVDECNDKAVLLNREQIRQIHDWLGAWLGR